LWLLVVLVVAVGLAVVVVLVGSELEHRLV
jgi:hypothetical protein